MLFDLRSPGRRRTIKVIYVTLAILMGGGLVFFGIGGNTQGGLFDAFSGSGGGGGQVDERLKDDEENAEKRLLANPKDGAALVAVTRARFLQADADETGVYSNDGKVKLREAAQSWERYLALKPEKPDDGLASLMVRAYLGLGDPGKAAEAQEVVIEGRGENANLYAQLAQLAYQAGQTRKGDLAKQKALALTPKDQREALKEQIEAAANAAPPSG